MMEDAITNGMIMMLNAELCERDSVFRVKKNGDSCTIHIKRNEFIDTDMLSQVYPNKNFYEFLEDFFRERKIVQLSYNNTHTTFWAFK